MSTVVKIIIGVLIALAVIAVCVIGGIFVYRLISGPEEATATPVPTVGATMPPTVEAEIDDSWDKVQTAGKIVVELKAAKGITDTHFVFVRSYLRAAGRDHGLILNFAKSTLEIKRVRKRTLE